MDHLFPFYKQLSLNDEVKFSYPFDNGVQLIIGSFTRYGCSSPLDYFVRISADFKIDESFNKFRPQDIYCVAQDRATKHLYIGGRIGAIARLDITSIRDPFFSPYLNGVVYKLCFLDDQLFVEGQFTTVNEMPARRKAVLNKSGLLLISESLGFQNSEKEFPSNENLKMYSLLHSKESIKQKISDLYNIKIKDIFAGFDNNFYVYGDFKGLGGKTANGCLLLGADNVVIDDFSYKELEGARPVVFGFSGKTAVLGLQKEHQWLAVSIESGKIIKWKSEKIAQADYFLHDVQLESADLGISKILWKARGIAN